MTKASDERPKNVRDVFFLYHVPSPSLPMPKRSRSSFMANDRQWAVWGTLLAHGNPEQKRRYLPAIRSSNFQVRAAAERDVLSVGILAYQWLAGAPALDEVLCGTGLLFQGERGGVPRRSPGGRNHAAGTVERGRPRPQSRDVRVPRPCVIPRRADDAESPAMKKHT